MIPKTMWFLVTAMMLPMNTLTCSFQSVVNSFHWKIHWKIHWKLECVSSVNNVENYAACYHNVKKCFRCQQKHFACVPLLVVFTYSTSATRLALVFLLIVLTDRRPSARLAFALLSVVFCDMRKKNPKQR